MNFEEIKHKMNTASMDDNQIPSKIKNIEISKLPIYKVRKSMRGEIITQIIIIAIFFTVPSIIDMHRLPQTVYYICMFITSLITFGYLIKMTWFLKKSSSLSNNSKETVISFIYELKLTLEVYKTAIISGSLLLPIAMVSLIFGTVKTPENIFNNLILLNVSNTALILYTSGYILVAVIIYIITVSWSDKLYGVHIKKLENMLGEFDV